MKIKRMATAIAVSSVMTLASAGVALADDVTITGTGPSSTNIGTINDNNSVSETNNNAVTVTNSNTQSATSGPANVSGNTNGGSATSGTASNNNTVSTSISINNPGLGGVGGGVVGGGTGGGSVTTSGGAGVGGGSLALAGGVGGGSLPDTGASDLVDVSALQSLFHPSLSAQDLANKTQGTSRALLIAGAILSLLGAIGSAVYANKKQQANA